MALPLTSEEAQQQAQVKGLTLLKADNTTGYFGVYLEQRAQPKPYNARVSRGGKIVHLGRFATAEEAALCIARSPEGRAAAKKAAAPPPAPPLTSEEVRQQAEAEGLTLLKADNKAGYFGVSLDQPGKPKPYQAQLRRGRKKVCLGYFATAEEAALCVARSPEGQAAAEQGAAPPAAPPLTSEEARQQAEAEGLTLLQADNTTGYFGVYLKPGQPKPYLAQLKRGGKKVHLGCFATAEEAALCFARSPEGRAAAKRAAAPPPAPPLTSEEALQQAQAEGLTLLKADNAAGYFSVNHKPGQTKPYLAKVSRGGKSVSLGSFATAEEAALCVARTPEGQEAAEQAAAAALTSEEARQQAQAEGLTLLVADNKAGYFGVTYYPQASKSKPYQAKVCRGAGIQHLGSFATAEEAALCIARSPEGQAAAAKKAAAPAPQLTSEEADVVEVEVEAELVEAEEAEDVQWAVVEGLEVVEVMAHEVIVDEGGRSEGRPKRRRKA